MIDNSTGQSSGKKCIHISLNITWDNKAYLLIGKHVVYDSFK